MKKLTMLISAILCASTLFSCAQDTATGTDTSPVTDKVTENVTDAVTDAVTDGVTEEITEIVTDAETEAPAGISDEEYKQQLMDKGFPESYAVAVRPSMVGFRR